MNKTKSHSPEMGISFVSLCKKKKKKKKGITEKRMEDYKSHRTGTFPEE
jgi:hypothetical protein